MLHQTVTNFSHSQQLPPVCHLKAKRTFKNNCSNKACALRLCVLASGWGGGHPNAVILLSYYLSWG